ncbi:MAG: phage shock protein A [Myxococcota bacterium]|jgi:phage shock protein A
MGFFDRIKNVVRGKTEQAVGDLERRNPEAVYTAAIDNAKVRVVEHRRLAAALMVRRDEAVAALEAMETELRQVMVGLQAAVQEDEDEVALVLLQRSQTLQQELEDKTAELGQLRGQVEAATEGLVGLREHAQKLEQERDQALAAHAVAQAKIDVDDMTSGLGGSAQAEGLASVRDAVRSLEAQAHEGYLDEEGHSVRGRAEAMGRKAAEQSARSQLARLKAQMRGEDDADPADDTSTDPDEAPTRDL